MQTRANRQIIFPASHTVEFQQRPLESSLEPDQMLVRTIYSLISAGTELAMYTGTHQGFGDPDNRWARYPFHPGYTAVGRIERIGAEVSEFKPGELIYFAGKHQAWSIISSSAVPLLRVDQQISLEHVPYICLGQIAYTAVFRARPRPGQTVAVLGLGVVGNLAAQHFRIEGCRVVAVDPLAFRREAAGRCGIAQTLHGDEQVVLSAVKDATAGEGADIVIEATGIPALVPHALRLARRMGRVVLLGSPRGRVAEMDVYNLIHRTGVALIGAHATLIPARPTQDIDTDRQRVSERVWRLIREGRLNVAPLLTRISPPDSAQQEYESLLRAPETTLSVVFDWRER